MGNNNILMKIPVDLVRKYNDLGKPTPAREWIKKTLWDGLDKEYMNNGVIGDKITSLDQAELEQIEGERED